MASVAADLAITDLVAVSGDLKRDLLTFSRGPRLAKAFRRALKSWNPDLSPSATDADREAAHINFLDYFMLQYRLDDGRTEVEQYVAAHPDLEVHERTMLLGWRDVVLGVFHVEHIEGDAIVVLNLIDEMTYRVYCNAGAEVFAMMPPGSFLVTRLVPICDDWLFSGSQRLLQSLDEAARLAATFSSREPALVFRNPEKLERAREFQREDRLRFMDFFGGDVVVLPGADVADRMHTYWTRRRKKLIGRRSREASPVPRLDLPPGLTEAATVGLVYDDDEGLSFYADFGLVAEAFSQPDLVLQRPHREVVRSYLKDDSVAPTALRRLAQQDTAKASRLFQLLLKNPRFSWERDGEDLLRRYKPTFRDRPKLPWMLPLGGPVLDHVRRQSTRRII